MEKNELEQLEEKMQNLMKKILDKFDEIDNIVLDHSHKTELGNVSIELDILEKEYKNLSSQYELHWQKIYPCSHVWYIQDISGSADNALGIRQCLRCKQINRWHTWSLAIYNEVEEKKMIWTNSEDLTGLYKNIRIELLELESEGYSLDEIREILHSKYTEKNEDLARNLKMKYIPKQRK